jgi:hypothetical protein
VGKDRRRSLTANCHHHVVIASVAKQSTARRWIASPTARNDKLVIFTLPQKPTDI